MNTMRLQLRTFRCRRQISPAQAHAAEHIDFKEPPPLLVGNILERLWLENAEVVYQDVHERESLKERVGRRRRR